MSNVGVVVADRPAFKTSVNVGLWNVPAGHDVLQSPAIQTTPAFIVVPVAFVKLSVGTVVDAALNAPEPVAFANSIPFKTAVLET
jgi:hypothetical protein